MASMWTGRARAFVTCCLCHLLLLCLCHLLLPPLRIHSDTRLTSTPHTPRAHNPTSARATGKDVRVQRCVSFDVGGYVCGLGAASHVVLGPGALREFDQL